MTNHFIPPSELILNPNGSVYHLCLKPGEVAETIITVGDQNRVEHITKHFEQIEFTRQSREFKTATGVFAGKRMTVISTGIGTDNIDIVLNELDALFQIDFKTRQRKANFTPLTFIRIGTSGAMQEDIPINSFVVSGKALAFDGLLPFYAHHGFQSPLNWPAHLQKIAPLIVPASPDLLQKSPADVQRGITATMSGFYAPQGRSFRLPTAFGPNLHELKNLNIEGLRVTNIEMETAGIYGLSHLLGHHAISYNAILANRITGEFSTQPEKTIAQLIEKILPWAADVSR